MLATALVQAKDDVPAMTFSGTADDAVISNIRNLVNIERYPCHPPRAQYGLLRQQIRSHASDALQAMGYYHPRLTLTLNPQHQDSCASVNLDVQPGPVVHISAVDIRIQGDAASDPAFRKLQDKAGLNVDDPLRHDHYSSLRKALQQSLISRGYVEGSLTEHRLTVDTRANTATVTLHVDSGPRYHFGQTTLHGGNLNDRLLRAYLQYRQDDPFDNGDLLATQQAYLGTSYFSAVRVQRGEPDRASHSIPVDITFTDNNRWSLLTGIGASTDTGPRLRLGVENRRVNRAGHRFSVESELSEVRQGAGASYQIPLKDPVHERLDLHTSYVNETTDSNDNERFSTGADYIVELNNKWVATTSLEWLHETYQVADQIDRAELLIPGFQLSRVKADDPIYPRQGWRLSGKIRFADDALLSSTSFVQTTLSGKLIQPVLGGRILTRLDLGYTDVADVTDLPASIRFFAGGDSSVRGYGYEALGPEDSNGDVIGGRDLATASLEFDHPITRQWHYAVFTDGGNAFNELNNFDPKYSAGAGIRWRSPLGPIRLDFARALDESRSWRIHLSMGPDL
ncbi:autotransporter assembly complex protein TamA [Alcanivorax hongdengensis]|nr:autotransporter assembly complex family protein [Alcanivorax hongdengensis]